MTQSLHQRFTFAEYVLLEEMSTVRHEYLDGQAWAMAGGSPQHAAIAGNVIGHLRQSLKGKRCRVFTSDLRVRVVETGLGTYPDASVICGDIELDSEDPKRHTAVNPIFLLEVLSPTTADYDAGEKLEHYKRIEGLREVLLVSSSERSVTHWQRERGGEWTASTVLARGEVELRSIGCILPLDEIYFDPLEA